MRLEDVGFWSEVKLQILQEYAKPYSTIMSAPGQSALTHFYIDAFAGAGQHISRETRQVIQGSPLRVLDVDPPFAEYHFVDVDRKKIEHLTSLVDQSRLGRDVFVYEEDCTTALLENVFPRVCSSPYNRALCLLDPYGLHLDWRVIEAAGRSRRIDILLNFPTMDMQMNALLRDPARAHPDQVARMKRFWGSDSWRDVGYAPRMTLFGPEPAKTPLEDVAHAFQTRLSQAAGFAHVADPIPMRNSRGATLYYLMFASQKSVAVKIITDIFRKHSTTR